jgi:hypothetical protein
LIVLEGDAKDEHAEAYYDRDMLYRYALTRRWADGSIAGWIMLNPSTATEIQDDPTIRRVRYFSKRDGYDGFMVVNLFAYRTTDPDILKTVTDAVGPDNDTMIREMARRAAVIVAAWGTHIMARRRGAQVTGMMMRDGKDMMCLGVSKDGKPKHPLYVLNSKELEVYRAFAEA